MKNMKKVLGLMLAGAMVVPMVACGSSSSDTTTTDTATTDTAATEETTEAETSDEGTVLNIQCWNEEFKSRLEDHYPGYEKVDDTTGKIGDVTVKFTITPSDDNAYQNNLDSILPENESASADDKVDIFLVEADYAKKYIDSDVEVTEKLSDLGITDSDLSKQYQYTKDIVTDSNGDLRGASWQACSAGLIYNRAAALEVLGTDDPEEVQALLSSWDDFKNVAGQMQAAGYTMCSVNDTYRVYSNNVTSKWVEDGAINIDANIEAWVNDSKEHADAGQENTYDLWGDDWAKGKYPDGNVFCYFGPAWFFNFSLAADDADSIAAQGGWGYCEGPQSFYWGGTWIAAAKGTDNPTLVKDIILTMTTDDDVMKEIAQVDSDCVNNKDVLEALAADDSGNLDILGGQNPYAQLAAGAELVDMSNISNYDQGCTEEFQTAMKDYFEGNATYDEALSNFYTAVETKYPELTH